MKDFLIVCLSFFYVGNIAYDISGISTKAPCKAALMGERHVRIEISDFVMRTFVHSSLDIVAKNWYYPTSSLNIAPRLTKRHETAWS